MQRHYIQLQILKELLKKTSSTFTDLNTEGLTNDHFNFHLKQLVKERLISKEENQYALTVKGLEIAGRLDMDSGLVVTQPKVSISLGIFRNNDSEVLLTKRTRSPSLGQYAWLDRKWRIGSSTKDEVDNLLLEEAELETNNFTFAGATHVIRKSKETLEIDVVALYFKIVDPKGELKIQSRDGENFWMKIEDVKLLPENEKIRGLDERLETFLKNEVTYQEIITEG